jgi:putative transposase
VRRNSACCQSARSGWFTPDLIEFAQLMVDEGYSHGISSATFYAWKAKFGGMEPSEAKRLKALEDENGKLKRLLAEAMLDNTALKDLLSKKW